MKTGEVVFETLEGEIRNLFVPVDLNSRMQVLVPSLQFEDYETGETRNMFNFISRKRNSSRQIIARCALGRECQTPKFGLQDTEFFVPSIGRRLYCMTNTLPFVIKHTFGWEQLGTYDLADLEDEALSNGDVGVITERLKVAS